MRSFVSIPAGVFEMPLVRYVVLTLIGSAVWAFAFAGAGWGLGTGYEHVHRDFRYVDYAVVALAILALGALAVRFARSSRLRRRAPDSAG